MNHHSGCVSNESMEHNLPIKGSSRLHLSKLKGDALNYLATSNISRPTSRIETSLVINHITTIVQNSTTQTYHRSFRNLTPYHNTQRIHKTTCGYAPNVFIQIHGMIMTLTYANSAKNQHFIIKCPPNRSTHNAKFTTTFNDTSTVTTSNQSTNLPNPIMVQDPSPHSCVEMHDSTEIRRFDLGIKASKTGGDQSPGG